MVFKPQNKPTEKHPKKSSSSGSQKKSSKNPVKKKLHNSYSIEASTDANILIEGSMTSTEAQFDVADHAIESGRSNDGVAYAKLSVYKLKDVLQPLSMNVEQSEESKTNSYNPELKLGLVSKYGGTVIKHGVTTVHETSVIGTYIDGKYAQLKSSTSTIFMAVSSDLVGGKKGSVQVVAGDDDNNRIKPSLIHAAIAVTSTPQINKSSLDNDENLPLEALFEITKPESTTRKSFKSSPKVETTSQKHLERKSAQETFLQRLQRHRQNQLLDEDADAAETIAQKTIVKPSFRRSSFRSTTIAPTNPEPLDQSDKPRYTRRAGYIVSKKRNLNVENNINKTPALGRIVAIRKLQNNGERWRYRPSPKPFVNIQGKNRYQQVREERTTEPTTTTSESYYDEDFDESYDNYSKQDFYSSLEKEDLYDEPAATVTPSAYSDIYLELVTLKSPQVMKIGNIKSTRYLTVTKTSTRHSPRPLTPEPEIEVPDYDEPIQPEEPFPEDNEYQYQQEVDETKGGDVEVPQIEPVNREEEVQELEEVNEDIEDSHFVPELMMSTITETFSSVELMTKTSIVPFTREFLQTDLLDSLPETSDDNSRLDNSDLNFKDDYDENIPNQKRVLRQPYSTLSDLSEIDNDFDPTDFERFEILPSIIDTSALLVEPTPPLEEVTSAVSEIYKTIDATPIASEPSSLTAEQMQQFAMMRYVNQYAALNPYMNPGFGFGMPPVNPLFPQASQKPVFETSDVFKTDLVPIWNGVSTIYSSLTRKIGETTITKYENIPSTSVTNPFLQYTVMSSPVTVETMTTSTDYRTYRIIFRAQATMTTVTSTTVFPTVVTSYVTSSIPLQPTMFPNMFPGMGGLTFPGFLG
nr:EOG090X017N [Artemia franciscana]